MHVQFPNVWPKPDPNPDPNRNVNLTLILTLAKSHGAFCKLLRLTNCMQQKPKRFDSKHQADSYTENWKKNKKREIAS